MPSHLLSVLSKQIPVAVQLAGFDSSILKPVRVKTFFRIADVDLFFHWAELALAYFKANVDEKKLSRRQWAQLFPKEAPTTCAFLNTEVGVFVLSHRKIGEGTSAKVKLLLKVSIAQDEKADEKLYTVKIFRLDARQAESFNKEVKIVKTEARIGLNQGYFVAPLLHIHQHPRRKERFYLIALYHGITVEQWIESQNPSKLKCLDVAIDIASLIHQKHEGTEGCEGIVLRDIKLPNFLIDEQGEIITAIDYGYAIEHTKLDTEEDVLEVCGTPMTAPFDFPLTETTISRQGSRITARLHRWGPKAFETFSYKRLCMMTDKVAVDLFLNQTKDKPAALVERVDTRNVDRALEREDAVLEIGACMVLHRYQLEVPSMRLSLEQQKAIMKIHFDARMSEDEKMQQLKAFMATDVIQAEVNHRAAIQEQEIASLAHLSFFFLKPQRRGKMPAPSRQAAPNPVLSMH